MWNLNQKKISPLRRGEYNNFKILYTTVARKWVGVKLWQVREGEFGWSCNLRNSFQKMIKIRSFSHIDLCLVLSCDRFGVELALKLVVQVRVKIMRQDYNQDLVRMSIETNREDYVWARDRIHWALGYNSGLNSDSFGLIFLCEVVAGSHRLKLCLTWTKVSSRSNVSVIGKVLGDCGRHTLPLMATVGWLGRLHESWVELWQVWR